MYSIMRDDDEYEEIWGEEEEEELSEEEKAQWLSRFYSYEIKRKFIETTKALRKLPGEYFFNYFQFTPKISKLEELALLSTQESKNIKVKIEIKSVEDFRIFTEKYMRFAPILKNIEFSASTSFDIVKFFMNHFHYKSLAYHKEERGFLVINNVLKEVKYSFYGDGRLTYNMIMCNYKISLKELLLHKKLRVLIPEKEHMTSLEKKHIDVNSMFEHKYKKFTKIYIEFLEREVPEKYVKLLMVLEKEKRERERKMNERVRKYLRENTLRYEPNIGSQ